MLYKDFKKILQNKGLKATNQRFQIYKTLVDSKNHPSAEEIYNFLKVKFPALTMDTIYRTLNSLIDLNLAEKLNLPGGATRFDGTTKTHNHFFCECCGAISDIYFDELKNPIDTTLANQIGSVRTYSILFKGIGNCCQN